ncbi:hypothetical protein ABNF97_31360 [Plantactinospora sp. B6F1]|uniref:hypothetical protein n=1 Tax=Plantactinospora sp. B6F1 TaxID=3158971 RepID=UPI0010EFAF1B
MDDAQQTMQFLRAVASLRDEETVLTTAHTAAVSVDGWPTEDRPSDEPTQS